MSKNGLATIPEYVTAVKKIEYPKTKKQVRALLGKFNYYRRHIFKFSEVIKPLSDLVRGKESKDDSNEKVAMTEEVKKAINVMKDKLTKAPILAFPEWDSDEPFVVTTDASKDCVACIITQKQSGVERVLLYDSKKTNDAQSRYDTNRLELLAFVWTTEAHRYLLYGRPFIWRTDHSALKQIKTMKPPKQMVQRWLSTLSHFDFEVEHRKGKSIPHVDFLSRNSTPNQGPENKMEEEAQEEDFKVCSIVLRYGQIEDVDWAERQNEDENLRIVRGWVAKGEPQVKNSSRNIMSI